MASNRPTLSAGDRAKHSLPEFECVPKQFHDLLGKLHADLKGLTHLVEKSHTFYKWFEKVAHEVYPRIGSIAHAVPPVFIGTHDEEKYPAKESDHKPSLTEAGRVFCVSSVPESDQRGEKAHRIVGRCLRILNGQMEMQGQKTMFIMSEIHVDNVLSWLRSDKGAGPYKNYARIFAKPVPFVDEEELQNACKARGEADLLVLHLDKGVVLIQVKSVSREAVACAPVATSTQKAPIDPDASIIRKLKAAENQLRRDQGILETVMKQSPQWSRELSGNVRKVIAVPNLSTEDVARFKAEVGTDIIFLCKEDTLEEGPDSIAKAESETDIKHFERWWTHSLPSLPSLPELFDLKCMKQIIGIYIGPLSTVSEPMSANIKERVRSFKNAIKYTGLLFARSLLTNRQTQILETDPQEQRPRVYISGPPGSGKTILLALKGSNFLEECQENHVIVLNMYRGAPGRAIGQHTFTMLHKNATHKGRVHHLEVDVEKKEFVDKANRMMIQAGIKTQGSSGVKEAGANQKETPGSTHTKRQGKVSTGSAQKGKKCKQEVAAPIQCKGGLKNVLFLVDEIYVESFWKEILDAFRGELTESEVWCAGLFSKNPTGFKEHELDFVLRCPPAVQNLLYQVDWNEERKEKYRRDTDVIEVSTNGPIPLCIRHKEHTQEGSGSVINCGSCAEDLARILNKFKSINTEPRSAPPGASKGVSPKADSSPAGAEMKVVILINLPRSSYSKAGEYIETTDAEYTKHMAAVRDSPFIKRLKRGGIEVELKVELACKKLADCPEPPFDAVATWLYNFQGLEGDVVIFLPGDASPKDKKPGHAREIPTPGLRTTSVNSEQEAGSACGGLAPASQSHGAVAKDVATGATGVSSPATEYLTHILKISSVKIGEKGKDQNDDHRPNPAGANGGDMDSTPCSLTPLQWNTADVARYSDWDQTNILIAGSRCLSQLILLVP